jgi:hypothetical protein
VVAAGRLKVRRADAERAHADLRRSVALVAAGKISARRGRELAAAVLA